MRIYSPSWGIKQDKSGCAKFIRTFAPEMFPRTELNGNLFSSFVSNCASKIPVPVLA